MAAEVKAAGIDSLPGDDGDAIPTDACDPDRISRDEVVSYIRDYVHSGEQLLRHGRLVDQTEASLRRWLKEDAPTTEIPPADAEEACSGLLSPPRERGSGVL